MLHPPLGRSPEPPSPSQYQLPLSNVFVGVVSTGLVPRMNPVLSAERCDVNALLILVYWYMCTFSTFLPSFLPSSSVASSCSGPNAWIQIQMHMREGYDAIVRPTVPTQTACENRLGGKCGISRLRYL